MYLKGLTFSMAKDKNSSLRSTPDGTLFLDIAQDGKTTEKE